MNHYTLLQIEPRATEAEIQTAYRKLVKRYHPDRYHHKPEKVRLYGEEKLKQINVAYGVLSNPLKRKQYDATLPWQTFQDQSWQKQRTQSTYTRQETKQNGRSWEHKQTRQQQNAEAQANLHKQVQQAREEYLQRRSKLTAVEQEIHRYILTAVKQVSIITAAVGIMAFVVLLLFQFIFAGTPNAGLFLLLELWLIQVGAAFLVLQRLGLPFDLKNLPRELLVINAYVLVSHMVSSVIVGTSLTIGASWISLLLHGVLVQAMVSGMIIVDSLKPLLAKRRKIELEVAAAEDVLAYFRQAMEL